MPCPIIDVNNKPLFQNDAGSGLYKRYGQSNTVTITGTGMILGDVVTVTGTKGTTWSGTITTVNNNGTYVCANLYVSQLESPIAPVASGTGTTPLGGGMNQYSGSEDVTSTVKNPSNGTSAPVTTPGVTTIP